MARELTTEERDLANDMIERGRAAMAEVEDWSQENLDRLAQAGLALTADHQRQAAVQRWRTQACIHRLLF